MNKVTEIQKNICGTIESCVLTLKPTNMRSLKCSKQQKFEFVLFHYDWANSIWGEKDDESVIWSQALEKLLMDCVNFVF